MTTTFEKQDFILKDVRGSLMSLFRPYKNPADPTSKPNYHVDLIMSRTHPQFGEVQERIKAAAQKTWGAEWETVLAQLQAQDRLCIHKGEVGRPGKPEYAGQVFISANRGAERQPVPQIIVSENGVNKLINDNPAHPFAPYSGCWINAHIDIWGMKSKPGQPARICAGLLGVQFYRHDTRLGGTTPSSMDEFGVVATDADGAAPAAGGGDSLI
jgi:hypothetical protein